MDPLSSAASVIAVIQLTGSLVKICGGYIQEAKDARDDIITLQQVITGLQGILQELHEFLQSHNEKTLPTSSRLVSNITECLSDLRTLQEKVNPGKEKNLMRKIGFRALKWPLKRTEVEGIIQRLERYKSSFILSLQVDQSSLMVDAVHIADRINQDIDLGKLEIAVGAGFGSFSDRHEVQCLPGTRTELLWQIREWATSPSQKIIFWLKGMAGTGKSTISRTVAESLNHKKLLGASFFFKRGEGDRGSAEKFFPTITRQLMLRIAELRPSVRKTLDQDPDITSKSLREQFEKLLLQPLLNLDQLGQQPQAAVIVIDALDECEHDQDIRNIIRLLPRLQETKAVRLRIFLTSRPELPIGLGFSEIADHKYQDLALHEIPEEVATHDIHLFLQDRFTKIKRDRNISHDWPGDNVIQELVTMSVPLFISAATVCRYIELSKFEPKSRLAELRTNQAKYVSRMDKTYLPILTRLLDDQESDKSEEQQLLQEFQKIVGVIILLAVPLSINALSRFLGIGADQISNRLDSFRSVLNIPSDRDRPVRMLHLSFRDFLVQSRSEFLVDEPTKHKDIAMLCLKTMRSSLKKDICNLASPGAHRADIDAQHIRQFLPSELEYSCRYWIYHLEQSQALSSEIDEVILFLQKHFLHWVEAMSILGLASEIVGTIDRLLSVTQGDKYFEKSEFLYDAKRFILKNGQIVNEAPLQVYCSGLVFTPRTAIVRTEFERELPSWINRLPEVEETWNAELQTLEGHSDSVRSLAFSPNGRVLASSSEDQTIKLWDAATGSQQQTLEGHSDWVGSLAFSPDGRVLASGSWDQTVKLWDIATGALKQILKAHSDCVRSVAFSPDGQVLASSSLDQTVNLWDTATGALQQTLRAHLGTVESVVFSPDSRVLASGSEDQTVKIWDAVTGALQKTLKGHSKSVRAIAFSPDGRVLASGSWDKAVKLWDAATGTLQRTLEGHSNSVRAIAFSPDGRVVVSGSDDKTIKFWDIATSGSQKTLKGHSSWVGSVVFSPNGRVLASGSEDQTVKIWDVASGSLQQTLQGHSGWVLSIAFSLDGRVLASGSWDKTAKLWDAATGVLQQTLESHSDWLLSIVFSPDGRILASGSKDQTVKLWDIATGTLQRTLKGHLGCVESVAFSPDGLVLASGSVDQTVKLWDIATGALQKSLEVNGQVTYLKFSGDGSHLITNLGSLSDWFEDDNHRPHLLGADREIFIMDHWISLHGTRVLWLPAEYRALCFAIRGGTLALGHTTGRISFIGFCV